jgi:hypothetical protein
MGSSFVVFFEPFFGDGSDFADISEQVGVKNGFMVHAVESFDITVLNGPIGLNKLNLNFMFPTPPLKLFKSKFRAVVRTDDLNLATPCDNALQRP